MQNRINAGTSKKKTKSTLIFDYLKCQVYICSLALRKYIYCPPLPPATKKQRNVFPHCVAKKPG